MRTETRGRTRRTESETLAAVGRQALLNLLTERASEEINRCNLLKTSAQSCVIPGPTSPPGHPKILEELSIVSGSRVGEPFLKLCSAVVVDRLDLKNRGLAV